MTKHLPAIKYTSRDFDSIKEDLVSYAKRYYPRTFKDFNEAGFGAMMLDTVAYVGDILSFYLDYSVNESFLDTAAEYDNVLKLGRQMGFRFGGNPTSYGIATFYVIVPANASGLGPDVDYIPMMKRLSSFTALNGAGFLLNENVNFTNPGNKIVVARVNETTGLPTHYAIQAYGRVISGRLREEIITVGDHQQFLKVELETENISEIISVDDQEGSEYFQVDFLSQDVIYKAVANRGANNDVTPSLLKPFVVPRRFTVEREAVLTFLQFGAGSERDTTSDPLIDPSTVVLKVYGRDYISAPSFDPSNLLGTDKLGISPANTKLRVVSRTNDITNVNVTSDGLTEVNQAMFVFDDEANLDPTITNEVRASVEINNDEPLVGDVTLPTSDELKVRMYDVFATQNRAVTAQDYKSMAYSMPKEFGALKRVNLIQDPDSFKRNLNMYVIAEDPNQLLITANSSIKNNLKMWLNQGRMVNDTVDILDAIIINIGIDFVIKGDLDTNRFLLLERSVTALRNAYRKTFDIGEPFFITNIYKILQNVEGIMEVLSVKITQKTGANYADAFFDMDSRTSADGKYIDVPKNVVLEVKYPDADILGSIK